MSHKLLEGAEEIFQSTTLSFKVTFGKGDNMRSRGEATKHYTKILSTLRQH